LTTTGKAEQLLLHKLATLMSLVSVTAALFSRGSCLLLNLMGMRLPILMRRCLPYRHQNRCHFGAVGEVGLSESLGLVLWYRRM
jgi:hypothetical protein